MTAPRDDESWFWDYFEGDLGVYIPTSTGYDGTTTPAQEDTMDRNKRIGLIFAVGTSIVFWASLIYGIVWLADAVR